MYNHKCKYCDSLVPPGNTHCPSCGSALEQPSGPGVPLHGPYPPNPVPPQGSFAYPPNPMPGVPPQGGFGYPPNPYPNAPAPGPQVIIINNQQGGHHPQPQIQQAPFPQQEVAQGKSHCSNGVALLLCFLLGVFGAHRFYVGRIGSGLAMLLISIIPAFADSDIGFVITVIWAIIDFLLIVSSNFKDSHGRKLSWH